MNQGAEVNKGLFIAAIVIVVIIAGFAGYYFLNPAQPKMSTEDEKKYEQHSRTGPTEKGQPYPGMTGPGGSGSSGPGSGGPTGR